MGRLASAVLAVGGSIAIAAPTSLSAQSGILLGSVKERAGAAIVGALVELEGTGRRTLTNTAGEFRLDSIRAGAHVLRVTREGYRELRSEVRIAGDSAVAVMVTLEATGQRLRAVEVRERQRNRLSGVVLLPDDRPAVGVHVGVVGAARSMRTDEEGRFTFVDLPVGSYLVEARAPEHEIARHSVRMVDGLERDLTIRMRPGTLTLVELANAAMAETEAGSREAMRRRAVTIVMGRDQLDRYGRIALEDALRLHDPGRYAGTVADQVCVVVDGWRVLGRGVQTIASLSPGGSIGGGGTEAPAAPPAEGWLRSFFAHQVERVEFFPKDTDDSRTLCSRFAWGSGCACPDGNLNPPTAVLWLRR
jgi:hypothetical protein